MTVEPTHVSSVINNLIVFINTHVLVIIILYSILIIFVYVTQIHIYIIIHVYLVQAILLEPWNKAIKTVILIIK